MKLNRLPVLIRTEVTAAAKSANLPAVYSRALVALEEAVEELSFSKLKHIEISADMLASWAKASQDEKVTKQARELKNRARRAAGYIAEKLSATRRAEFMARGVRPIKAGRNSGLDDYVPGTSLGTILLEAGYKPSEVANITMVHKLPEPVTVDTLSKTTDQLRRDSASGKPRAYQTHSECTSPSTLFGMVFRAKNSPFSLTQWCRNNNARGVARRFEAEHEIAAARYTVTLVNAWCDEFLKNLPRNVSKAKV